MEDTDIVERLRTHFGSFPLPLGETTFTRQLLDEAADRIERLRAHCAAMADMHLKLRSIRYHADNGHQDRPVHERLRLISKEANEALEMTVANSETTND